MARRIEMGARVRIERQFGDIPTLNIDKRRLLGVHARVFVVEGQRQVDDLAGQWATHRDISAFTSSGRAQHWTNGTMISQTERRFDATDRNELVDAGSIQCRCRFESKQVRCVPFNGVAAHVEEMECSDLAQSD